ncbi:MAG: GTPase HflX [Burkholderiales bacterium]|nr:GTPase HflX [Anaerolineae bacterium]
MTEFQVLNNHSERVFLVAADVRGSRPLLTLDDSLRELALLADTAGMEVVGQATQHMNRIDSATFIGSGKVEEIKESLEEMDAHVVIFDDELSPRHQRELEKRFGENIKVLDRSALILDIFAQHARTREGALQVELAQYEYRLPRLTRQWTHLARQAGGGSARGGAGGVGLRGPGETQLEVDRREIGRKIIKLKVDIERVRTQRSSQRQQRTRAGIPVVALVGYTNAGKSTLLRALSGADIYVADQLFATLDPTTRRIDLPSGRGVLVTDTVGFIQKLPTTLVVAFRATLEEITEADVLLHVVDTAHPNVIQHIETVEDTLAEIEMPPVPRILVWNKTDLWQHDLLPQFNSGEQEYAAEVMVSAQTGAGTDRLLTTIEDVLASTLYRMKLLLPYQQGELVSMLHEAAVVEGQEHTENGVVLTVRLPASMAERFSSYRVVE